MNEYRRVGCAVGEESKACVEIGDCGMQVVLTDDSLLCFRNTFDEDRVPELTEDLFVQDVHCISSLLKMYFRELPNPLFTYLLYDKFAVSNIDLFHVTISANTLITSALCN